FLREIFVYVAPENFVLAAWLTHDGFVFSGTTGVFACIDKNGAVIRKDAFVASRDLFIKLWRVEIPVNPGGLFNAVAVQLLRSVFAAQVFSRNSCGANRSH